MKSEIFDFMAMKSAFMGFSRYFHGIFMKKIFIVKLVTCTLHHTGIVARIRRQFL